MKTYKVRIPVTTSGRERHYLKNRIESILIDVFDNMGYDLVNQKEYKRKHKKTNTMRVAYVDYTFYRRSFLSVLKAVMRW